MLFLYMTMALRMLYTQKLKCPAIPTGRMVGEDVGLATIAKFTVLVRKKTNSSFIRDWKLVDFLHEKDKNNLMICGFYK